MSLIAKPKVYKIDGYSRVVNKKMETRQRLKIKTVYSASGKCLEDFSPPGWKG